MNLRFDTDYDLPGYGCVRITELYAAGEATRVKFCQVPFGYYSGDVSLQEFIDQVAEQAARKLFTEGWYCISGKYLTIARYVGYAVSTAWLRVSNNPSIERKNIDVDTYVALKKLRRAGKMISARNAVSNFQAVNVDLARAMRDFTGAWGYHRGGYVREGFLRSNEIPAILKPGKEFFPQQNATLDFGFRPRNTVAERIVADYKSRGCGRTHADQVKIMERLLRRENNDTLDARLGRAMKTVYAHPSDRDLERALEVLKAGELK